MIRAKRFPWPVPTVISLLVVAATTVFGTLALPAAVIQAVSLCNAPYDPVINAADFRNAKGKPLKIDNPYFPLVPGTTFVYEGPDDEQIVVRVTTQRKTIQGVSTTVVSDKATVGGQLAERTFDWFAQDKQGNVWYFGEDTKEFPSGSTDGSWEAGKDGAKPGIIMKAHPQVGDAYRQEFAAGVAEDIGEVQDLDSEVSVPFGEFGDALQTRDGSCLESGFENKYYAPDVGLVLETGSGGKDRVELVSVTD